MQFSAVVNRFIVKTYLNSTFTNDLKENKKNQKMFIAADLVSLKNFQQAMTFHRTIKMPRKELSSPCFDLWIEHETENQEAGHTHH